MMAEDIGYSKMATHFLEQCQTRSLLRLSVMAVGLYTRWLHLMVLRRHLPLVHFNFSVQRNRETLVTPLEILLNRRTIVLYRFRRISECCKVMGLCGGPIWSLGQDILYCRLHNIIGVRLTM